MKIEVLNKKWEVTKIKTKEHQGVSIYSKTN